MILWLYWPVFNIHCVCWLRDCCLMTYCRMWRVVLFTIPDTCYSLFYWYTFCCYYLLIDPDVFSIPLFDIVHYYYWLLSVILSTLFSIRVFDDPMFCSDDTYTFLIVIHCLYCYSHHWPDIRILIQWPFVHFDIYYIIIFYCSHLMIHYSTMLHTTQFVVTDITLFVTYLWLTCERRWYLVTAILTDWRYFDDFSTVRLHLLQWLFDRPHQNNLII